MMSGAALPKRQINIAVDGRVHANLERRARERGFAVSAYAKLLFEAAYAARIARERDLPIGDAELDEQVRAVFCLAGEFKPEAISRALGLPLSLVEKILAGWKKQGGRS